MSNLLDDPAFLADLNSDLSSRTVADRWPVSKSTVNKYRAEGVPESEAETPSGESETHNPDGSASYTRFSKQPWGYDDYRKFIQSKGQNPDEVTFTWGWTSNPGGGFWNKLNHVRPIANVDAPIFTDEDLAAAQKRVRAWKLPQRIPGTGLGAPVAAVLNLADIQLFKPEGGGVEATEQRLFDGLVNFQQYVKRQRASGRNIDEIAIINNGDPFEGVAGNYANQLHTVKAGLRKQMNGVLDIWEAYSRELYPQFDKGKFVTVHCNHTQFGRQGGAKDSITGDEDTGSAFLAETLQRTLRGRAEFDHVEFVIPDDEMNVYATIAGVPVAFNHGHKIPGTDAAGFEKWLNGQVRGDRQAYEARIWITAHKHHFAAWDMGSTFVFQCPSCDGGSKWLRDTTGRFSRSGILALLVGEHDPLGWSDQAFL